MSRSGYSDDYDSYFQLAAYRSTVASATRGKRGQRFFRELVAALDAMSDKRLIAHDLENPEGVCTLGALGRHQGKKLPLLDPEDDYGENGDRLAPVFDIASQLAKRGHVRERRAQRRRIARKSAGGACATGQRARSKSPPTSCSHRTSLCPMTATTRTAPPLISKRSTTEEGKP